MSVQTASKLLLASAVAACCALTANAQTVDGEFTGTISSLQGAGWGSGIIGQSVTFDVAYDASQQSSSFDNDFYIQTAPVTSASIVGGWGSGINLESGGPGTGSITASINTIDNSVTASIVTKADAPDGGFTGNVFGLSYITDGINTTVDVVKNAFDDGIFEPRESGVALLSNVVPGGQAPEIDPASTLSALTLLTGGLAVIRGKRFAKPPAA